jgi:hypothetical protein
MVIKRMNDSNDEASSPSTNITNLMGFISNEQISQISQRSLSICTINSNETKSTPIIRVVVDDDVLSSSSSNSNSKAQFMPSEHFDDSNWPIEVDVNNVEDDVDICCQLTPTQFSNDDNDDRRETLINNSNNNNNADSSLAQFKMRTLTESGAEVASLSSLTSDYSQFDFTSITSLPPPPPQPSNSKLSRPLTSLFGFSNSFFGPKKQKDESIPSASKSTSLFDIVLNTKTTNPESNNNNNKSDTISIKTNHSFNSSISSSSSSSCTTNTNTNTNTMLIFENRPSNLPSKSESERIKHQIEYDKMVSHAKRKQLKENQSKLNKLQQQINKEDFMANSLKIWNTQILPDWSAQRHQKRTLQLWWHGLPSSIRGKVWMKAQDNSLCLNKESYQVHLSATRSHDLQLDIGLDVERTFPQLCFFQRNGGPMHSSLLSVLGAYASYNPRMGYVQGMSFVTAVLLLNLEFEWQAFVCLANMLSTKYLAACFQMDQTRMTSYFRVHQTLFQHNLPDLHRHFERCDVKADLYLIEWIFTLFSKSLPLDVVSRVWDVFFRDREEFLFRACLGILALYKEQLLKMDFIHIVQFLTKLPDDINSTLLFKSIEQIETKVDFEFEHLC